MLDHEEAGDHNTVCRIDHGGCYLNSIVDTPNFTRSLAIRKDSPLLLLDRGMYVRRNEAAKNGRQSRCCSFRSQRHGSIFPALHLLLQPFKQLSCTALHRRFCTACFKQQILCSLTFLPFTAPTFCLVLGAATRSTFKFLIVHLVGVVPFRAQFSTVVVDAYSRQYLFTL